MATQQAGIPEIPSHLKGCEYYYILSVFEVMWDEKGETSPSDPYIPVYKTWGEVIDVCRYANRDIKDIMGLKKR